MTKTTKADGTRTYEIPDGNGGTVTLPSVTTILRAVAKPALITWAANQVAQYAIDHHEEVAILLSTNERAAAYDLLKGAARRDRDSAADVGTQTHDLIEQMILDPDLTIDPDTYGPAGPYLRSWLAFTERYVGGAGGEFVMSEATVANLSDGWAGTLDALLRVPRGDPPRFEVGALDWKTRQGKKAAECRAYESEVLQVSAYMHAEFVVVGDRLEPMPELKGGSIVMLASDDYRVERIADAGVAYEAFLAAKELWGWLG